MPFQQFKTEGQEITFPHAEGHERCLWKIFDHVFVVEVYPVQSIVVELDESFNWFFCCLAFDCIGHVV